MKNKFIFAPAQNNGALAQLVEQWTENPCVPGSIPGGTTLKRSPRVPDSGAFSFSKVELISVERFIFELVHVSSSVKSNF